MRSNRSLGPEGITSEGQKILLQACFNQHLCVGVQSETWITRTATRNVGYLFRTLFASILVDLICQKWHCAVMDMLFSTHLFFTK